MVKGSMHRLSTAIGGLLILLLPACAVTDIPTRWAQVPKDQNAVVFGTVTAELGGPGPLSRYLIRFRSLETKEVAHLSVDPGMAIVAGGDPELYVRQRSMGQFFEITIPAGQYEFFDLWMVAASAFGSTEYRPKEQFSIPFKVEAGTVNYLGEFRAYPTVGRNIFGMLLPAGGYFVVRDQEARDTQLLIKRRGGVPVESIRKIVLDLETNGTSLVRRSPLPPFDTALD
jgi:hypothetical protein